MLRLINTNNGDLKIINTQAEYPNYLLLPQGCDVINDYLSNTGRWEYDLIAFAKNFRKPKTTVLDIGANIGVWSVELARGFDGYVHSFEPIPKIYRQCCANLFVNNVNNVSANNFGLSDVPAIVSMMTPDARNLGASRIVSDTVGDNSVKEKINVKTLRDYAIETDNVGQSLGEISLIKIDVEGHEINALTGGQEIIEKNKPVIFFESWQMPSNAEKNKQLMSCFIAKSYNVHHYKDDDFYAIPLEKAEQYKNITTHPRVYL